jgi:hypothetical protein
LLCAFHFTSFAPGSQPLVTDVRYFVHFGWRVAHGAVPHLDYFENKTQLASFAGALLCRSSESLGVDALIGIRWGYLSLAAAAGLAAYFVHRRLGNERDSAGLIGLLAYCSFGLLGTLPAIGNVPKLVMALGGSLGALLVHRRRFLLAGVVGSLSFMDWQVGGLVVVGALLAAAVHERPRGPAVARVLAGAALGLAPFVLYYSAHGALDEAVRQVVGSSFVRGSETMAARGLGDRLSTIAETVRLGCPGHVFLFYVGLAGMLPALLWCWRDRRSDRGRLLLPLGVYHFGVLGFSLVDFQRYGDLFLLLHSVAFFLGVLWIALSGFAASKLAAPQRPFVAAAALVLVFAVSRPGILRPPLRLATGIADPAATLDDQRAVAASLDARIGKGSVAFLENGELLFLMRRANSIPAVYWNLPAWHWFRRSPAESMRGTAERILAESDADAVVPPAALGFEPWLARGYSVVSSSSENGRYSVRVAIRSRPAPR